jgi:hypothetical protein
MVRQHRYSHFDKNEVSDRTYITKHGTAVR